MTTGLDRCFAAVVCGWEESLLADRHTARRASSAIERLSRLGVEFVVVAGPTLGDIDVRLRARPAGPGRLHVCLGDGSAVYRIERDGSQLIHRHRVSPDPKHAQAGVADTPDSLCWVLDYLAGRGIGPGLMLVVGHPFGTEPVGLPPATRQLPGGALELLTTLDRLIARLQWAVPDIDDDPSWTLHLPVRVDRDGVDATLTTLADGRFGSRGVLEDDPGAAPALLAGGVYVGHGSAQRLLEGPHWAAVRGIGAAAEEDERVLDLRTGVLLRHRRDASGEYRSLRVGSAAHPGVLALRAQASRALFGDPLGAPLPGDGQRWRRGLAGRARWLRLVTDTGGLVLAASQQRRRRDGWHTLERRVALVADAEHAPGAHEAVDHLQRHARTPFTAAVAEQRAYWAARWADADILVPDDPELQLAARFALFQLTSGVSSRGEAAVGARGLSGGGYRGHVFWDADVFVLPVLAASRPAAARAMLEYRLRRLAAARAFAAETGHRGARFPWESARDGTDVTPSFGLAGKRDVPVRTGQAEEHIVADVAWAACHYAAWAGDNRFLTGEGLPLVIETARYWASRIRIDADGRGHLDGVIGPDEYHVLVDDNAYTNLMARWNLRAAARLAGCASGKAFEAASDTVTVADTAVASGAEIARWRELADSLIVGYDKTTGIIEQFAGYHRLEPLLTASLGRVPIAADLLLGPERVAATQVIKQADVLMAYHLIPAEVPPGTLAANLAYYGPRTAHGSSLSPAIHAALLARSGAPDDALDWLRLAARLDLDDKTGTSGSGLHLATLGGVWQAFVRGFGGLDVDASGVLRIRPQLPTAWKSLTLRLRVRGARVQVTVGTDEVRLRSDRPLRAAFGDRSPQSEIEQHWSRSDGTLVRGVRSA